MRALILFIVLLLQGCDDEGTFNYVRFDTKVYPQYLLDDSWVYHNILNALATHNFQVRYLSGEYIDTDFRYHTFEYHGNFFIVRDRCFVWIRQWGWEYRISFTFTLQWGTNYADSSFRKFANVPQEFEDEYKEIVELFETLSRSR